MNSNLKQNHQSEHKKETLTLDGWLLGSTQADSIVCLSLCLVSRPELLSQLLNLNVEDFSCEPDIYDFIVLGACDKNIVAILSNITTMSKVC